MLAEAIERAGEQLQLFADRATDGWDAIEMLECGEYAAIVIDTDLPRHSGYGVLSYLREEKGDHLRNVILMSSDLEVVRQHVRENLQIIHKTETVEEIASAVTSACCAEE